MIYIITGTSQGIGRALATRFLEQGNRVIGISRRNEIEHPDFSFIKCDFTEKQQLYELDLSGFLPEDNQQIILINNAGVIGEIKRTNQLTLTHYTDVAMVNIVAAQFLCSYVLQTFGVEQVKTIINISSGAATRPIPAWGAYCASKAAINLFSETLQEELKEMNSDTKVYAIAPGVVDTNMQVAIRNSDHRDFSAKQNFVDLKENDELRSPEEVANLLDEFLQNDQSDFGVVQRI